MRWIYSFNCTQGYAELLNVVFYVKEISEIGFNTCSLVFGEFKIML